MINKLLTLFYKEINEFSSVLLDFTLLGKNILNNTIGLLSNSQETSSMENCHLYMDRRNHTRMIDIHTISYAENLKEGG